MSDPFDVERHFSEPLKETMERRFRDIKDSIDKLALAVVTKDVWAVEQRHITDWLARIEREHITLETHYQQDKERYEERRRERAAADMVQRAADRRLIYGGILTGAIAIVVSLVTKLYGGA